MWSRFVILGITGAELWLASPLEIGMLGNVSDTPDSSVLEEIGRVEATKLHHKEKKKDFQRSEKNAWDFLSAFSNSRYPALSLSAIKLRSRIATRSCPVRKIDCKQSFNAFSH